MTDKKFDRAKLRETVPILDDGVCREIVDIKKAASEGSERPNRIVFKFDTGEALVFAGEFPRNAFVCEEMDFDALIGLKIMKVLSASFDVKKNKNKDNFAVEHVFRLQADTETVDIKFECFGNLDFDVDPTPSFHLYPAMQNAFKP